MSPKRKEQVEAIREASKAKIIASAFKLFSAKGFINTSISDIARDAGISKGLMYNYFESKEALLEQTLLAGFEKIFLVFIPAAGIADPAERLEFFIRTNFKLLRDDPGFWKMFVTLTLQLDKNSNAYAMIWNYWSQLFENAISIFTEMGTEDPKGTAYKYGALMDGLAMQYLLLGETQFEQFDQTLESVINEFCKPNLKS